MNIFESPEFFAELCNAVYRGAYPDLPEDGLMHTSDVSRRTAWRIVEVLRDNNIIVDPRDVQ